MTNTKKELASLIMRDLPRTKRKILLMQEYCTHLRNQGY